MLAAKRSVPGARATPCKRPSDRVRAAPAPELARAWPGLVDGTGGSWTRPAGRPSFAPFFCGSKWRAWPRQQGLREVGAALPAPVEASAHMRVYEG